MSKFVVNLSRNENYKLSDDTLLCSIIYQHLLKDFESVESYYFKYKTFVQSKFKNVLEDEDGGGYMGGGGGGARGADPTQMINDLLG